MASKIQLFPTAAGALASQAFKSALQRAIALHNQGRLHEAKLAYEEVLRRNPRHFQATNMLGTVAAQLGDWQRAISLLSSAIAMDANVATTHNNLGNVLFELKRYAEAQGCFERAVRLQPGFDAAHQNLGNVFARQGKWPEAIASFSQAWKLAPMEPLLLSSMLRARYSACDWRECAPLLDRLTAGVASNEFLVEPFSLLALVDDPALQLQAARSYGRSHHPENPALGGILARQPGSRIRIGYYSADFHNHATSYLMAELLEAHDRANFEVHAFSFGPAVDDEMRRRVASACEHFHDVRTLSDMQVAQNSRDLGIDIAVDLKGYTLDERGGIFALRCAPVQVSYLGYPGTLGLPYMDYILADEVVIPGSELQHYSEQVVWLPVSYQPNDSRREIADHIFTRAECGLPERGFVFCSFNASYKITPEVFASWMRILQQVEGSVLWLLGAESAVVESLRREARQHEVDPSRLIFGGRLPLAEHLARQRLADLFLDNFPCNAHTTASDALWAGVPVLTRAGRGFAARVAASLLTAVGLPELITESVTDYEAKALHLAHHPHELASLRERLARSRNTSALFRGADLARHIEAAYVHMARRQQAGLPPAHFSVSG